MPVLSNSPNLVALLLVSIMFLIFFIVFSGKVIKEEKYIPIQPLFIEIPPGLPNKDSSRTFVSYENLYNKKTMCPSPPGTKCKVNGGDECKVAEMCMHYVGEEYGTCVCSIMNDCMQDGVC
jgi:hypothetical protein